MVWPRIGDNPLSEPMMTRFPDAYMQILGRWVNLEPGYNTCRVKASCFLQDTFLNIVICKWLWYGELSFVLFSYMELLFCNGHLFTSSVVETSRMYFPTPGIYSPKYYKKRNKIAANICITVIDTCQLFFFTWVVPVLTWQSWQRDEVLQFCISLQKRWLRWSRKNMVRVFATTCIEHTFRGMDV